MQRLQLPPIASLVSDPALHKRAANCAAERRKSDGAISGGGARRRAERAAAGKGKYGNVRIRGQVSAKGGDGWGRWGEEARFAVHCDHFWPSVGVISPKPLSISWARASTAS